MKFRRLVSGALLLGVLLAPSEAQTPRNDAAMPSSGFARVEPGTSRIEDFGSDLHVELTLTRPVPWQVYTLDDPRRVVLDFSEIALSPDAFRQVLNSDIVSDLRFYRVRKGWSRLVLDLDRPMRIETAGLATGTAQGAVLKMQLAPTSPGDFAARSGAPQNSLFDPETRSEGRVRGPAAPARLALGSVDAAPGR